MEEQRIPATERHAELVEAAARAIVDVLLEQPAISQVQRGYVHDLMAEAAIAAVGDALRLEGAQAENARLQPIQQAKYAQGREQGRLEGAQAERVRVVEGLVATIKALRLVQEDWIDQNEKPAWRAERGKYRRVFNEAIDAVLAVVEAAREDTTAEAQDEFHRQARALDAACTSDTDDPPDFKTEDEFDGYP